VHLVGFNYTNTSRCAVLRMSSLQWLDVAHTLTKLTQTNIRPL